jgi:hypothetical protein
VPQVCDAVAVLVSPSAKSLVIPAVRLPVQSAARGEPPGRDRATRRIGEAKDASEAAQVQASGPSDMCRRLRLPVHINGENSWELCSEFRELDPSDPGRRYRWASQGGAGVVRVTCIITPLSPWSRTGSIRSSWRSRAGFVNRRHYRSEDRGPKMPGAASQAVDA